MNDLYERVVEANIDLHSRMADAYNTCEPHFRSENVQNVTDRFRQAIQHGRARRQLDLGCGTGFMINIGKQFVDEVVGVDVTQAMLDQVDRSGPAAVTLVNHDTGSFQPQAQSFDVVTAYSFLHHLYDIRPTLETAYEALRDGGIFYADLDPNYYYWQAIASLDREAVDEPILKREIEQVTFKDEDITERFGIDADTFNQAEYSKNIAGGFREEDIRQTLLDVGFRKVELFHHWFVGEGWMINDASKDADARFEHAGAVDQLLQRVMPLSRHLFKYIGFYATR